MSSKRIFQKITNLIAGRSEYFSLEHRFLNATLIITLIIAFFAAINNLLIFVNYTLFIVSIILLATFAFCHYLSRNKRIFFFPAFGLYFTISVVISYFWIVFSGIRGPGLVFFSILLSFYIFLFEGYKRLFVILFTSANIAILFSFNFFYPESLISFQENWNNLIDMNIGAVVFIFLLLFVITSFKRGYIKQQELLYKTAEALRKELNEKKIAETELAKFNENLENLLDIRTKKLINELAIRKKAEQTVIREHNILRTIMEATPEAIAILDKDGSLIDCNIKTLELLGHSSKEHLIGKSFFEFLKFNNHNDIVEKILGAFKENTMREIEYSYTNDKGEFVALILLLGNASVAEENNSYNILVAKDITQWKLAEEELHRQSKQLKEVSAAKDKFLSIIAHDLRNPLSAIIGFSDLLANNYSSLSEKDKIDYLQNIRLSSESMLRLLMGLLDWSKSQSGKMVVKPEEINVFHLVNEVKDPLRFQALNKKIELDSDIKSNTYVVGDKEMVKTILRNLISNAIKFTPLNGTIKIVSNEVLDQNINKEFVEISVIDNGVGIKKENLEKITSLNQNVRTKGTNDESGSGLGLLLCKELIEKNNGYFYIKSMENSGSTFTFALPKKNNGVK